MFTKDKELLDIVDAMKWEVYDEPSRIRRKQAIKIYKTIRSRKLKAEASKAKNSIVEKYGSCSICGFAFKPILQTHHILPISKYGDNSDGNVICVCPNCHKTLHYMYSALSKDSYEEMFEDAYLHFYILSGKKTAQNLFDVIGRYVDGCRLVAEFYKNNLKEDGY